MNNIKTITFWFGANVIYNPYNTTVQNPGFTQPGMIQQASYPVGQQTMMPMASYPTATTQVTNTTAYQPVQQSMPMATVMPVPPCPVPACGAPVPCHGGPVVTPVQPMVMSQQVQTVQQPSQPQVASTQQTTTQHKKTTYVEAYLEPVDAQVPLMQPSVQKKGVEKQTYPVQDEIVYVDQKPVKNSTMQDYNLYLMEKEYYSDDEPNYKKTVHTVYPQTRADKKGSPLTCENLPLATAYVRMQPYTALNNPTETLQQGTAFNELYDVYTPQKVAQPNIFMLKGGCR